MFGKSADSSIPTEQREVKTCLKSMMPVRDALDVLNGKWKLPILMCLSLGSKRFGELSREITGITPKMLSKELKDMETHQLVTRVVSHKLQTMVEYSLTGYSESLSPVIDQLAAWGLKHRERMMTKSPKENAEPANVHLANSI
jgi:DNA-binding HxlR family transcriptional regulator